MLFIKPITTLGGRKLDIKVASMATVPGTVGSMLGKDFETDLLGLREDNVCL